MITFDDVLLNPAYSQFAKGGPQFANARSESTTGNMSVNISRQDYISEYEIGYVKNKADAYGLRAFHILRWGDGYAFRFLAPDDNNDDGKGILVDANGAQVSSVTNTSIYYLAKLYTDAGRSYIRRIIKPVSGQITIKLAGSPAAATIDYTNGKVTMGASGSTPTWTGNFHLAVMFITPFNDMQNEPSSVFIWTGIKVREVLPIALGISP